MEAHQLALSLPSTPAAASEARHQAVDAIAGWDTELDAEVVHTAELLVSELVTNAVQYAGTGSVSLTVCLDEAVLRVEVCDASPVLPQPALPAANSEGGRGLFLVAALADRYQAEPTKNGKRCWAEIDLINKPSQEIACFLPLQRS
ncbi:ATP-binding protein [Streptomyces ipomoeae]|jgi:anti-sigma regulatory factor (Ser/Thr protein kinase)|uniref:ATPase/histidine kinase/DNA gyrase B/HSP90 domain protein n=1 Tax=Streptomyces ipomoeae 91-03 TaxID=698759 RepID=L1KVC5_9ACTN|nr:ATP-binding protein [Streptomyces ipomoeae]EKX64308.1 ATPase/histidine kinase/DNA gyrase B/HSP90 domain protein [Streptomyces ipomoeae 91-03]MDX2693471.1 ATP-binding protein [Streptomyces ipomoeae]MDX2820963.1 ATP-binding protein [Streptomyces ipomoeae]MDX2839104.1 ATP-binding protein [Streptomyces ipomoeae]MDX2873422.1 ATP-binding protein [Streptomyces ipomoeae]